LSVPKRPPACSRTPERHALRGSVRPERIAENLDVFDFALTPDEIATIGSLDTGECGGPNQDEIDFRTLNQPIPE
jgi:2,5-diketo-D-gluconate reductase A